MKSKTQDKFMNVRRLVRKLGELAMALDDVSKKMQSAVEKQKATLGKIDEPTHDERRVLNHLHEKLEAIECLPTERMEIQHAQELSEKLLEDTRPNRSGRMSYHEYIEMTGIEEFEKFRKMPPLREEDFGDEDWEDLYARLADTD